MEKRSREGIFLEETKSDNGGAAELSSAEVNGNHKLISSYDLVEPMHYLYIRIVKANDLSAKKVSSGRSSFSFKTMSRSKKVVTASSCDPYAEVELGNYKGVTRCFEKNSNPEWNQVFAFWEPRIQDNTAEVRIMNKDSPNKAFMGQVLINLDAVPKQVSPDTPLSPQWYKLKDRKGEKVDGELMLAVWWGTQADEAFQEAWHSDAHEANSQADVRSKLYISPKLWYLRVNVIEAQDLVLPKTRKSPEIVAKVTVGNQVFRTRPSMSKSINPVWNQDLIFVVAEPFEEPLVLDVIERVAPSKDEVLGKCVIPLKHAEKRLDHRDVQSRWFKLETDVVVEGENNEVKFASRIHTRFCLEGGYHVMDESGDNSSDFRPTDERLWKSSIGVLEVGILKAQGFSPMKTRHGRLTTDAYCVAKYGQKWARTRTICDSDVPKWNEQYAWNVFDTCTVLTVGVFDNGHFNGGDKDSRIGKVRIRVSTLESGQVYTHSYPLLVLHPSGLKKRGEIQLAVRFISNSTLNMIHTYSQPLFPEMHYSHPLSSIQLDILRHYASLIISAKLGRTEPPLRKEVVEYMLDVDSNMYSFRRTKANYQRVMVILSGLLSAQKWFDGICNWKNPLATILVHVLVIIVVWCPKLIMPSILLYLFLGRVWYYRWRPRYSPHVDTLISCVDDVEPDELQEEFDTFPSSAPADTVRKRYDRLRVIGGRIQTSIGELATQGERIQSLLEWRDPRPTTLFTIICLAAAIFLYFTPIWIVALLTGFYILRHPRLRNERPSVLLNCFRRLPGRSDSML